ncbi:MAG TPA: HypC/HybG/HupF family hydrogenase formation chaperone [Ktedonobacteraceae bacterium]|nr:HypC/HybG/HupF family hydrogenase formation chaperone [Ktedonobacteraceae bacterium]
MSGESKHPIELRFVLENTVYCNPTADGHCATCSDEALQARVLGIDEETGLALVEVMTEEMRTEEIDITLVDNVAPGDLLLVHGGVAIGNADQ